MALIAHQTPGSYASFSSSSKLWTRDAKFKPLASLQFVGRLDRNKPNRRFCLRSPTIFPAKVKRLKVSAFKGGVQNDESGRSNGSKTSKNHVKLSYVSHDEEIISESPETQKTPLSYSSGEENIGGSPAIQKLFKKWLIMLRTQSLNQSPNGIFEDGSVEGEIPEAQNEIQKQEKGKLMKAAWGYILGLDATIKIPLLIFVPLYLAVTLVYGAEVSKELTPLWVFGPIIAAIYIKLIQGLCALYVFTFRQTVRVLKSSPSYFRLAQGKLKETLFGSRQSVDDIKNLKDKRFIRRKLKEFREWAAERQLDFVESIWPFYSRTVRFLKAANFI